MTFWRLLSEELRATLRSQFALLGGAGLMVALTASAALVAVSQGGFWGFGLIAYVLVPSFFSGLAAAQVAGARRSRFLHGVLTAGVSEGTWLCAKLAACLVLGFAYVAATLPFLAVVSYHVGPSPLLMRFLAAGATLAFVSVSLGVFLGVLFTGRNLAAPVALALSLSVASLGIALPGLPMILAQLPRDSWDVALRLLHLSPHAALLGFAGVYEIDGIAFDSPWRAWVAAALSGIALCVASLWIFLREQSADRWEAPAPRRTLVALCAALLLASPAAIAQASVHAVEPVTGQVPLENHGAYAILVRPGAPAGGQDFSPTAVLEHWRTLDVGERQELDLLILLPLPPDASLARARVRLSPDATLRLETPADLSFAGSEAEVERGNVPPSGSGAAGGTGAVLRLPLVLVPLGPDVLSFNAYRLGIEVTYRVEGEAEDRQGSCVIPVLANVPHARSQMLLGGIPLVLPLLVLSVVRKARTGGGR